MIAALVAVVLAVPVAGLVARPGGPTLEAAAGGEDSALRVYSDESTTRISGGVAPGEAVVVRLANVCVVDGPVAVVGVELREPGDDLRVGDVVVTVDEDATGSRPRGRPLAATRIAKKEAVPGNVVSHGCDNVTGRSHMVFAELVLDRRARVVCSAFRYVYEDPPGGEVRRTDWVEDGVGLDTRASERGH